MEKDSKMLDEQVEGLPRGASEDPLVRFLIKWRQTLFTIAIVLLAGYYMWYRSERASTVALESAADTFAEARKELSAYDGQKAESGKAGDDKGQGVALQEKLRELSSEKAPYDKIAGAYALLMDLEQGKLDSAEERARAAALKPQAMPEAKPARFFQELELLLSARALTDKPELREKGISALKHLAQNGTYVSVSAALSLARTAQTAEEREDALTILQAIQDKNAVQAEVLQDEIKRLS